MTPQADLCYEPCLGIVEDLHYSAYLCDEPCNRFTYPENRREASPNDYIYAGSLITTPDIGSYIEFKTKDVSACGVLENSMLQIRPNGELAIEWLSTGVAGTAGESWCIKREGGISANIRH